MWGENDERTYKLDTADHWIRTEYFESMGVVKSKMKLHSSELKIYVEKSKTYSEYTELIDKLLAEGKTTGSNNSEAMVHYGKLNRHRMTRLAKTTDLDELVEKDIRSKKIDQIWLVITEGWCGDAAQNIPVIEKLAAANPGIQTRYLLRDENPDLIDLYLTRGSRSIPKVLVIDRRHYRVVGTWGPRPMASQKIFDELQRAGAPKSEILETLQRWYNDDHGKSIQREFQALIDGWATKLKRQPRILASA